MSSSQWTSHSLLQPACQRWLQQLTQRTAWFPGPMRDHSLPPKGGVLDVVLFGDFVDQIASFQRWPHADYDAFRVWVLSKAVRKVCVEVLGFAPKEIGVIPRYELFPPKRSVRPWPKQDQKFSFVYSGRLAAIKNFDLYLRLASYLQTSGDFPNMEVVAAGSYPESAKHEDVSLPYTYLMLSLPWRRPPKILTGLGPNDWQKAVGPRPVLVNLSQQRREDFGVSVAQAQVTGWPCLLSNWGGHRDVWSASTLKIPSKLLPLEEDRSAVSPYDISSLGKWVTRSWGKEAGPGPVLKRPDLPHAITLDRLRELRTPAWDEISKLSLKKWIRAPGAKDFRTAYDKSFSGS